MQSSLSYLGLPETFGGALLLLALVLLLSPYLADTDLGFIKIPEFEPIVKRRLRIFGPIAMVAAVLLHVPLVPRKKQAKRSRVQFPDLSSTAIQINRYRLFGWSCTAI